MTVAPPDDRTRRRLSDISGSLASVTEGHHEGHGSDHGWGGHGGRRGHRGGWEDLAGGPWGQGRRVRRGDVRIALLAALAVGDAHGYELIRRLEQRSGGLWRPSAGSVYPTLQLLEDEGLVVGREEGGKRVFSLTEAGRAMAAEPGAVPPWVAGGAEGEGEGSPGRGRLDLREAVGQVAMAARQVAVAGDPAQVERARQILQTAKSELYRVLAGD